MFCALMILLARADRRLRERVMDRIPPGTPAAMLAGCWCASPGGDSSPRALRSACLAFAMFRASAGAGARCWRRHRAGAGAGQLLAAGQGRAFTGLGDEAGAPVFMRRVQLADRRGQHPAVHRHHGLAERARRGGARRRYTSVPMSPVIGWTGAANLLLALFGFRAQPQPPSPPPSAWDEAHEDPAKRYLASVLQALTYPLVGVFGATVGRSSPPSRARTGVLAIAGLALFGTTPAGCHRNEATRPTREPALITFLVTASGVSLGGIGSAFWGVVAGSWRCLVLRWRMPQQHWRSAAASSAPRRDGAGRNDVSGGCARPALRQWRARMKINLPVSQVERHLKPGTLSSPRPT